MFYQGSILKIWGKSTPDTSIFGRQGKCRLAGVAMVKNEADIIELFIKINSRVFERLYILDHNSEDRTAEIVEIMCSKGYPVELVRLVGESAAYNQAEITTRYVNQIAKEKDYDFVMPIDGDEFLYFGDQDIKTIPLEKIAPGGFGLIPWVTYCPRRTGYLSTQAPLYHNFEPRNKEPRQYYKVVLTRELAKTCVLQMGNHGIDQPRNLSPSKIPLILQHVPVRTPEQISSKAYIGSKALALKPDRKPGEGAHWDNIYQIIKRKNMQLSHEDALDIALNYAADRKHPRPPRFRFFGKYPRIGTPEDTIDLKNEATVDFRETILRFDSKS
ncbi:MAG: glycosyltransferase family 2 protein [Opitutales bacterium]|nr:glycosyltransferase family 2 protein [Opitutales bacterium]